MNRTRILVDWGTTNLRAYLVESGPEGPRILERTASDQGILAASGRFSAALDAAVGAWRRADAALPILMSGMIGSRQGWVEAPYADCPAGIAAVARQLVPVPGVERARIVPGVAFHGSGTGDARGAAAHDVMRGEEVQIFGALGDAPSGILCLPGTHSKWARVEAGAVAWFATSMTGEAFDVLRRHSILGRLMPADAPPAQPCAAFDRGLARAAAGGGLLHHLFAVRADGLFGDVPAADLPAYLSGILIGAEVAAMREEAGRPRAMTLVCGPPLDALYERALAHAGIAATRVPVEPATVAGLTRIADSWLGDAA